MPLKKLDRIDLYTTHGFCQIELLAGDITCMTLTDKVDLFVLSTHPRTYSIRNEVLIKSMRKNMKVMVDELSRDVELDLRKNYDCWVSKPSPSNFPFNQIVCFERQADSKNVVRSIRNIFRGFTPIFDSKDRTVITNLLGTWYQDFNRAEVLNMTVNAACNWIKVGLPLRCFKIVLCEKDDRNNPIDNEDCIEEFLKLKEKWTASKILKFSTRYDVYISYSQPDEKKVEVLASNLLKANKELSIFYKPKTKITKAWPDEAMLKIHGCKIFIPIITSYFLKDKDCLDEFFTAICYTNKIKDLKLMPLVMETIQKLPPTIRNYPGTDCKLTKYENLADKLSPVCEEMATYLDTCSQNRAKQIALRQKPCDIYISYSDAGWKELETAYKILKANNPDLNIFYDKLGLENGHNWTCSVYKVLEEIRCCILLVTREYFKSTKCKEVFNIAVAQRLFEDRKKEMAVIPVCVSDFLFVSEWFGNLSIIDARDDLFERTIEKLSVKLNESFKYNTIQEDFDWLIQNEMDSNKCFKTILRDYRQEQFHENFFEQHGMVISMTQLETLESPCNILVCFSNYDRRIAGLFVDILLHEIPWINLMLLNKPDKNSFDHIQKADQIVMFVCEDYLTSPKGLEILSCCLGRQRKSNRRMLHFACTSIIPSCFTFLRILPYSIVFSDQIWGDLRKRYYHKEDVKVFIKGVNGKFTCERFEYMALEKLVQDIMYSERFGCYPDELQNIIPFLEISRERVEWLVLDDVVVPCPKEYDELGCLSESLFEPDTDDPTIDEDMLTT